MSNQWLRLWHDMPTDPKWRTIARVSAQPISLVQAVFLHLLVEASRNVTRGHADVTAEDLASALDVTDEDIDAVLRAMQGRVLDGMALLGWEKRQPLREDAGNPETGAKSAAQRKADERARKKAAAAAAQVPAKTAPCHAASRTVTTEEIREEEIRKENIEPAVTHTVGERDIRDIPVTLGITPSTQAAVCVALKSVGIGDVNPGHLTLTELIDAGIGIDAFVAAGRIAVTAGKGFAYTLGIVKGQAAQAGAVAAKAVGKRSETPRQKEDRERYEGFTGRSLDSPGDARDPRDTIDMPITGALQ